MGERAGDPCRVVDVRFAPRHRFDVAGVGQDQLEGILEQMPDRFQYTPVASIATCVTPSPPRMDHVESAWFLQAPRRRGVPVRRFMGQWSPHAKEL